MIKQWVNLNWALAHITSQHKNNEIMRRTRCYSFWRDHIIHNWQILLTSFELVITVEINLIIITFFKVLRNAFNLAVLFWQSIVVNFLLRKILLWSNKKERLAPVFVHSLGTFLLLWTMINRMYHWILFH